MQWPSPFSLSYHRALARCRICSVVAASIFLCIVLVEAVIFLPSYVSESARLRDEIAGRSFAFVNALLADGLLHAGSSRTPQIQERAPPELKRLRIADSDGGTLVAFGDQVPETEISEGRWLGLSDLIVKEWPHDSLRGAYHATAVLDMRAAQKDLFGFTIRIGVLVFVIAVSATLVAMLVAGHLVLSPLLSVRAALRDAARHPGNTRFELLEGSHYGEMGGIAASVNGLLEEVAHHNHQQRVRAENTDQLTGLLNRRGLVSAVEHWQVTSARYGVVVVDLDDFARINDWAGTSEADGMLREVGRAIMQVAQPEDLVARLVSDEFAVVSGRLADPDVATTFANQLIHVVTRRIMFAEGEATLSGSCGVALSMERGRDLDSLCAAAALAARRAKHDGGSRVRFADPHYDALAKRHRKIERALRGAIARSEFHLAYQPKCNLRNGGVVGAEALLRWRLRGEEDVSPAEFVPIAENAGLMPAIGKWVVRRVVGDLARWRNAGLAPPRIAVNLSAKQLRDRSFVDFLVEELDGAAVGPELLEFEVTESAFIDRLDHATEFLQRLADLGVRTAIDDFGTGYSSLSYLRQLPVHAVKIDRSFIDGIEESAEARSIVEAIVSLGRTLRLDVVAEGIETVEQASILHELDCAIGQGYWFGRPQDSLAFERMFVAVGAHHPERRVVEEIGA